MKENVVTAICMLVATVAISAAVLYGFAYTVAGAYEALSEGRRSDAIVWLMLVGVFGLLMFGGSNRNGSS